MFFSKKKPKGETLIEVIVAIGVVGLGAITASGMIISSIRNTAVNKNYLLADNLAKEGIEAVKSIRDTNWLRFSYDTENCWDVLNDEEVIDTKGDCKKSTKINNTGTSKFYRVNMNPKNSTAPFKFKLEEPEEAVDFLPAVNETAASYYLLEPDAKNLNLYRHTGNPEGVTSKGTSFYRAIGIKNESEDVNKTTRLRVASIVQWQEGGDFKEIVIDTLLTNYQ